MNLLVSGASGFIGRNFINRAKKYNIVSVSLSKTPLDNIDFSSIDTVLHLAALVHQMKGASEEKYYKTNSDLPFTFAKKAKEKGVKHFIFISTAKVFGESTKPNAPFNENSDCKPTDPYSKSKLEAEERLKAIEDDSFKVSIIRIPLVYGAGAKGNLNSLMNLVKNIPLIPLGDINNKRTLLYVGNLIDILIKIIDQKQSGIFIACDNVSLSTTQLLKLIALSFNKRIILFKMPFFISKFMARIKPEIIERLYGSFELNNIYTNQILEYTPRYTIEEGIKEMVTWYKKNKLQKSI